MQRAYLYGDLLFETMLATHGNIPHISRHFNRLERSAKVIFLDLCGLDEKKFITESLNKLNQFRQENPEMDNQRVRFVLSRLSGGFYLPDDNKSKFEIQVENLRPLDTSKPIKMGIFELQQKAPGPLSNLKNGNALIYVMARIWGQQNQFEDVLITNTNQEIIESSSSNIFWQKDGKWFTPPLNSGCVAGIGRELFMESHTVTEKTCYKEDLVQAETCLLTNALFPERPFLVFEN